MRMLGWAIVMVMAWASLDLTATVAAQALPTPTAGRPELKRQVLSPPVWLPAVPIAGGAQLSWKTLQGVGSPNPDAYNLYARAHATDAWTLIGVVEAQTATVLLDQLPFEVSGPDASFRVAAVYETGEGPSSKTLKLSLCADVPPPAPTIDAFQPLTTSTIISLSGSAANAASIQITGSAGSASAAVQGGTFTVDVPLTSDAVNTLYAVAVSACGTPSPPTSTQITVDTQSPSVSILFPESGTQVTNSEIAVAGSVGDLLTGSLGLTVTVNGVTADVAPGIGTNGTFELQGLPLQLGENTLTVVASDVLGNTATALAVVERLDIPVGAPVQSGIGGNEQVGPIGAELPLPIVVEVLNGDGTPFVHKVVTFQVTRSDGRVAGSPGLNPPPGALTTQVLTDARGKAYAWWTLGSDAGSGNNRIEATATDVSGTVFFCASATAGSASRIVVSTNDNQRAQVGTKLPLPIQARVLDGVNPVGGVPVTFTVAAGEGLVDDSTEFTVVSTETGLAQVEWTLGPNAGSQRVEASFDGNPAAPAVFSAVALSPTPDQPTTFAGLVLDNGERGIGGAICTLVVNGFEFPPVLTDATGYFTVASIPAGPAELFVDATTALTLAGQPIGPGTFPALHFENFVVVLNTANSLPMPIRMPQLNPANARAYSTTGETVLEVAGMDGLRLIITPGSMTLPNGTPAPDGTVVSLNQVHFDQVPMAMPDGAANPFAWTMQPGGSIFDPPVRIEFPNMTGLSPGAVSYFASFNHGTGKFDIVGTGAVTPDGSLIVSDPGSGVTLAGWGGPLPPPPPTDTVSKCKPETNGCGPQWAMPPGGGSGGALAYIADCLLFTTGGFPFPVCFTDACNQHDTCWGYCLVCSGAKKSDCDLLFYSTMVSTCDDVFPPPSPFNVSCINRAWIYYHLVAGPTGNQAYGEAQYAACSCQPCSLPGTPTDDPLPPPFVDSDGDLLPDDWELANNLNPMNPLDAGLDSDSDGLVNLSEYMNGMDPWDPDSYDTGVGDLALLLLNQPPAEKVIGDGWTVYVAGKATAVSVIGTFSVAGVPIAGGPKRVEAIGIMDGMPCYAASPFFDSIGNALIEPGDIVYSDTPFLGPLSLSIAPEGIIALEVSQSTNLIITGTMNDGSAVPLQYLEDGTAYQTTNPSIATVDQAGVITGVDTGTAYIIVSNQGVSATKRVDVVSQTAATTVTGVTQLENGTPVQGAVITTVLGGQGLSAADGFFAFPVTIPANAITLGVTATASIGGTQLEGSVLVRSVVAEGYTEVGVLVLEPATGVPTCSNLTWQPAFAEPWVASTVLDLEVYDDGLGGGPALYEGGNGEFGGIYTIQKWDGTSWSPLGLGVGGTVETLRVFDDGTGPALFVGGTFLTAGGMSANSVARWNGTEWSPLGSGLGGTVRTLEVFDDGSGPALYAGGNFKFDGSQTILLNYIAKWDGGVWSPLGSGMTVQTNEPPHGVWALTVFDDANGPALCASGFFHGAGSIVSGVGNVAKWDGSDWSALGSGLNNGVWALTGFDDGSGSGQVLYAGGQFYTSDGPQGVARWDGTSWLPVGLVPSGQPWVWAYSFESFDDGSGAGPLLYAGALGGYGYFVRKWDGMEWTGLGDVIPFVAGGIVYDMAVFDDGSGSGPGLFIGGTFESKPGFPSSWIAKWGCPGSGQ